MTNTARYFIYTIIYYFMWYAIHSLLFGFDPPIWVVLAVLFLSSTLASAVVEEQERMEKELEEDE